MIQFRYCKEVREGVYMDQTRWEHNLGRESVEVAMQIN
jgi:hypothetical protein